MVLAAIDRRFILTKYVGILTAGGDSPGLNAAIRGVGKAARRMGMNVIGFKDGFRGLMGDRTIRLNEEELSGILTQGGTILGTSRDKPHKMPIGDKKVDMTDAMVDTYHKHNLDVLVCMGGGGTIKNAYRLQQKGMNIITLPKTIDNDVAMTDFTFGFDTALGIATEAIDRLHSTAHSHHRIIVVEVMGHNTGWLALGAGVAGGADVILIPEIPFDIDVVAAAIRRRYQRGSGFSIVAISEGAMSRDTADQLHAVEERLENAKTKKERKKAKKKRKKLEARRAGSTLRVSAELEELTGLESRVTILGHVQRGGQPSAFDRLLATQLGTACAQLIDQKEYGVMVGLHGDKTVAVPLEKVVGKRKMVPTDHPWIDSARRVGTNLGD